MINTQTSPQITRIYLVTNCYGDPNKVYIGKTKSCRKNKHKQTYGKDIIYTYIDEVESIDSKDWKPLECFWIEQFKQWGFELMNQNGGGGGSSFFDDKTIAKISKPVLQYNLNHELINTYSSLTQARDLLGFSIASIANSCFSKTSQSHGYIFRYIDNPLPKDWKFPKHPFYKTIIQYDLEGNFIKEWNSVNEVRDELKISKSFLHCCYGKYKQSYGFIWKFK